MSARRDMPLCVYCRRHATVSAWRPFCSERCKLQDLARWAGGAYRIPGEPVDKRKETEKLKIKPEKD